jgi:hypothetical protein
VAARRRWCWRRRHLMARPARRARRAPHGPREVHHGDGRRWLLQRVG